jgi:next to BRCA1 gene 1 protein
LIQTTSPQPETVPAVVPASVTAAQDEDEIFGDAETVSLSDSDGVSEGFMTDEEYDILDASDEEAASSSKKI